MQNSRQKLLRKGVLLGILLGLPTPATPQSTPSTVLKGTVATSLTSSPEDMKRLLSDHVLTLVLARHIEHVLTQQQKQDQLPHVIWNIRDYVSAYAFENLTPSPGQVTYALHIQWSEAWLKLLATTPTAATETSITTPYWITPYWITLDERLRSSLPQPTPQVLQQIESQILFANTHFRNERVLMPATPLDKMLNPEQMSTLCQHVSTPGFVELAYSREKSGDIREQISYIPCQSNTTYANDKPVDKPVKRTTLTTRVIPGKTWLSLPPSPTLLAGWSTLYTQEPPTATTQPKKYFVRLMGTGGTPAWAQQDALLSQSLRHQSFVEAISLYSISQEQKTLELHLKTITEDLPSKLTQGLVSFCKNQGTPCEVSLEDTPQQALWLVKIPQSP